MNKLFQLRPALERFKRMFYWAKSKWSNSDIFM